MEGFNRIMMRKSTVGDCAFVLYHEIEVGGGVINNVLDGDAIEVIVDNISKSLPDIERFALIRTLALDR